MLLLYHDATQNYANLAAFTFHYASTLSFRKSLYPQRRVYLHSTMLLLYPKGGII